VSAKKTQSPDASSGVVSIADTMSHTATHDANDDANEGSCTRCAGGRRDFRFVNVNVTSRRFRTYNPREDIASLVKAKSLSECRNYWLFYFKTPKIAKQNKRTVMAKQA